MQRDDRQIRQLAEHLLHTGVSDLSAQERRALNRVAKRLQASLGDAGEAPIGEEGISLGERLADRVAEFGGSWKFISLFGAFLIGWTILNTELLRAQAFDPYPYVFLNLVLSMLAAIQAPIIMMSQNRQAARDRLTMLRDLEVNLKAEAKIAELHKRIDHLTWQTLGGLDDIKRSLQAGKAPPVEPAPKPN